VLLRRYAVGRSTTSLLPSSARPSRPRYHCFYEPWFLRDGLLQGVRLLFARIESWRHALEAARGGSTSVDDIKQETAARAYVRVGEDKVVHRDVLAREREIVHAVAQLAISAFRTSNTE
jgi:hypothetical protein